MLSDPWELTAEEVAERVQDVTNPVLRQILEALWNDAPRTQLNLQALGDMPSIGALRVAVDVMTESELRSALFAVLYTHHVTTLTPEEFERWGQPPTV